MLYVYAGGTCDEGGTTGIKNEPRRGPETCAVELYYQTPTPPRGRSIRIPTSSMMSKGKLMPINATICLYHSGKSIPLMRYKQKTAIMASVTLRKVFIRSFLEKSSKKLYTYFNSLSMFVKRPKTSKNRLVQ